MMNQINQWSTPNGDCRFCVPNSQSASRLGVARACGRKLCSNNLAMWQCSLRNRLVTWYGSHFQNLEVQPEFQLKTGDGKGTNPGRNMKNVSHDCLVHWTFTLEFWTFCALIFRRVVTFAIRVWHGWDLGIDFAPKEGIPAYLAIESSKANPIFVMTWPPDWFPHCRRPFPCPPWNMSSRWNGLNSLLQGLLHLQV